MNLIFSAGPSLQHRLALGLMLSVSLIIFDHKFDGFGTTRVYLNSLVSPLQYLANLPGELLNTSATRLASHQRLLDENAQLTLLFNPFGGSAQYKSPVFTAKALYQ